MPNLVTLTPCDVGALVVSIVSIRVRHIDLTPCFAFHAGETLEKEKNDSISTSEGFLFSIFDCAIISEINWIDT